ncbi:hypothetical protein F7734_23395 [Scytonema sp. UIC 10036]|uniref:hypothetical protein n=1 Tax=Scytonema sp. UIC 10036 TaxID=2304196 RepID=UPI00137CAD87|nr:hypothetical protein [Scytonema sp. UIC 10036]MUG95145.1 hypothetical protein [Scytonema sp. UIC 10036]
MPQKGQAAIANKIKKWVEAANELSDNYTGIALPITRLTSIKSLCRDAIAAQKFALYMSKLVLQQARNAECPDNTTPDEWEVHKDIINRAVAQMESFLEHPIPDNSKLLWNLYRQIEELQGDNYRRIHGTTIHFVKSGYLLKLNYAICCFIKPEFDYYAYKLAREYTECYAPRYGTGLTPESVPMLLVVAEFWCQYYFEESLQDKFPQLMSDE